MRKEAEAMLGSIGAAPKANTPTSPSFSSLRSDHRNSAAVRAARWSRVAAQGRTGRGNYLVSCRCIATVDLRTPCCRREHKTLGQRSPVANVPSSAILTPSGRCSPRALSLATQRKRVIVPVAEVACDDDTDEHQDRHFQATILAERCRSLASTRRLSGGDRRRADRRFVLFGLPSRIDGNFRACAVWIRDRDGNHRSFGP
jgi:hypothetical protein